MRIKLDRLYLLLAAGLAIIVLMGCQAAPTRTPSTTQPQPAPTATVPPAAQPTATQGIQATPSGYPYPPPADAAPTAYPVDNGAPTQEGYPAPGSLAPAIENEGRITGKVMDKAVDANNAGYTRLHVQVLTSEDVEGKVNMTHDLVNTETDLFVESSKLGGVRIGDQFEAVVTYRGDESGGKFMVIEMERRQ